MSEWIDTQLTPKHRITQLVDISPESIEEIADAVAEKLRKEEVKHGHWINERLVTTDDGRVYGIATCSECKGTYVYVLDVWNYCPNCGANMDEVTE